MTYDPLNWYWLHNDGRLYSSKRNIIIASIDVESDSDYIAWQTNFPYQGHWRQTWPHEENGNQTIAALQQIVGVYGIVVPGS